MAAVVSAHGGMLDKFAGDAVMAVFGAPNPVPDHPVRALRCAVAMQRRQAELNAEARTLGLPASEIGIGINTGTVIDQAAQEPPATGRGVPPRADQPGRRGRQQVGDRTVARADAGMSSRRRESFLGMRMATPLRRDQVAGSSRYWSPDWGRSLRPS
jgi:hypothetical protein